MKAILAGLSMIVISAVLAVAFASSVQSDNHRHAWIACKYEARVGWPMKDSPDIRVVEVVCPDCGEHRSVRPAGGLL